MGSRALQKTRWYVDVVCCCIYKCKLWKAKAIYQQTGMLLSSLGPSWKSRKVCCSWMIPYFKSFLKIRSFRIKRRTIKIVLSTHFKSKYPNGVEVLKCIWQVLFEYLWRYTGFGVTYADISNKPAYSHKIMPSLLLHMKQQSDFIVKWYY